MRAVSAGCAKSRAGPFSASPPPLGPNPLGAAMDTIIPAPAGKRARNGSVILTDRMCEKRVAKRVKFYDRKCPGLYVSITTAGVATFSFKFTDPATGKQRTGWVCVSNPQNFTDE